MEAMLSKEAMPAGSGAGLCRHCMKALAGWRCKDCVLASPLCRGCMRSYHRENPFHRIEQWNGSYFRPAALWEVGTYLLVLHHTGEALCDTLKTWRNLLESAEETKDSIDQEKLKLAGPAADTSPVEHPGSAFDLHFDEVNMDVDLDMEGKSLDDDILDDEENIADGDEDLNVNPYLATAGTNTGTDPALAAISLGSYHRVVHTNGIHHIGMVNCQCHGEDVLPLDLFAVQLLPASLKRIKTLFTAQVLDMFRLSNLELKASAYQFYQLLRRLTQPMAPAEVVNLYREFRRMSRIWRWMKKLKWAGYAGSSKSVEDVKPGELTIYCPACPQPGINIPDNWRDDQAR